jgi:hypothetical protein
LPIPVLADEKLAAREQTKESQDRREAEGEMSKLTEQLGTVGIHNPYDFAGHGNP